MLKASFQDQAHAEINEQNIAHSAAVSEFPNAAADVLGAIAQIGQNFRARFPGPTADHWKGVALGDSRQWRRWRLLPSTAYADKECL